MPTLVVGMWRRYDPTYLRRPLDASLDAERCVFGRLVRQHAHDKRGHGTWHDIHEATDAMRDLHNVQLAVMHGVHDLQVVISLTKWATTVGRRARQ